VRRNRNYFLTREILPYPLYICESLEEFLRYALDGWYGYRFLGIRVNKRKKLKCAYCGRETRFVVLFYVKWEWERVEGDPVRRARLRPVGFNYRPMCRECILEALRRHARVIVKSFESFLDLAEKGKAEDHDPGPIYWRIVYEGKED